MIISVIGISYALWKIVFSQTGTNQLSSTCFNTSFTEDTSTAITLLENYPISDEEGMSLTPYTFGITNNCGSNNVKYQVNLEILSNSDLPNKYIKVGFLDEIFILNTKETTTPTVSGATASYVLTTDYLKGGDSKNYEIRLWIDGDTPGDATDMMEKTFAAKITITSEYAEKLPYQTTSEKLIELAKTDTTNMATDDPDGNIRYIGADPNNYVTFNGEQWRIIGTFKNIDDGDGNIGWRTKIIRTESLGYKKWDAANVNEWTTASLNSELNGSYLNELSTEAQAMIGNTKWAIGKVHPPEQITSIFYSQERSGATWIGKIALMYPSDYGYAVGGTSRATCLNINLSGYDASECKVNDWLVNKSDQWTITADSSSSSSFAFYVSSNGYVYSNSYVYDVSAVHPVLYLSSNVKISDGSGTVDDPYQLTL